jgi:HAD superfamily phosphoserine phosphatase-like hydrolase
MLNRAVYDAIAAVDLAAADADTKRLVERTLRDYRRAGVDKDDATRARLKEINHHLLLGARMHPRELEPLVDSFADAQIATNVRPGARLAIARDKSEHRRIVLATASYRLYADAIAQRLGFDDVIGTGSVIGLDDRVHAKIAGENCYGPAKMRMIADWVERSGLKGSHGHVRFYSDHVSDEPAFEWADEPVAVNPHAKLRRLAEERGWAVEDWG